MTQSWESARNVLCIRLDSVGDVLMTTPAIRALKESLPGRRITLLTSGAGAEAGRLVPFIDDVMVYAAPWMKATPPRASSAIDHAFVEEVRRRQFDAAVLFTVYSQNPLPPAFLCYMADIPLRLAHCRENPYQLLTHWVRDPEPDHVIRHEVQRQIDLVSHVGCHSEDDRLAIEVPCEAHREVLNSLGKMGLDRQRPWAVLHPGATAPSRRYPWESYAEVVRRLASEHGWQIVLTGSDEEESLVENIRMAAGVPTYSLAGRLDLASLCALIDLAPVLITNNTGPAHIAAAVGTPVVVLYALTNLQHTPWKVPSRVLSFDVPCKNCYSSICPEGHHNCLRLVSPDDVVANAVSLSQSDASQGIDR